MQGSYGTRSKNTSCNVQFFRWTPIIRRFVSNIDFHVLLCDLSAQKSKSVIYENERDSKTDQLINERNIIYEYYVNCGHTNEMKV